MRNYESSPTITNCTFSRNISDYGGGTHNNQSYPIVTNCIFWGNEADVNCNEIYNYSSDPNFSYCDIEDCYDANGVWDANLGIDGGENIEIDPCFIDINEPIGSWTEDATYDSSTFQSILTDTNTSWDVNELAGKFINPDTSQYLQFFIVSNDANTIKVWSDVTSIADINDIYEIFDYHLTYDSNCVDAGNTSLITDPNATDIDGNPRVMGLDVDMGADEDFPHCHPDYNEWVSVGRPDCWCYKRQCHGDAGGKKQGNVWAGYWYVGTDDLNVMVAAWLVKEPPDGPGIDTITGPGPDFVPGICADFAHDLEGNQWSGYWRVGVKDLNELVPYWQVKEPPDGNGVDPNCLECSKGKQAGANLPNIEDILKWLEELWLNPDVQKAIDEDSLLKFIESVMKELQNQ